MQTKNTLIKLLFALLLLFVRYPVDHPIGVVRNKQRPVRMYSQTYRTAEMAPVVVYKKAG